MRRGLRQRSFAFVGLLALFALGCWDDPTSPEDALRVVLTDSAITFRSLGERRIITAELRTPSGGYPPFDESLFTWESSDTLVVRVENFSTLYHYEGVITAVGPGGAEILVRNGRLAPARIRIVVSQALVSVEVLPSRVYLEGAGAQAWMRAVAKDSLGQEIVGVSARWEADADSVAIVSAEGVLTAIGTGSGRIIATAGSIPSAPALVEVLVGAPAAPAAARTLAINSTWRTACGIAVSGDAYCWGAGILGAGAVRDSALPVRVAGDLRFASFSSNYGFMCAMTDGDDGYCWGEILAYPLPIPTLVGSNLVSVGVVGGDWRCSATRRHYCFTSPYVFRLRKDGVFQSQLEMPTSFTSTIPFVSISAGYHQTCGIVPNGSLYCWPVELEYTEDRSQKAFGSSSFTEVSVSGDWRHACAIALSGTALCRASRPCSGCETRGWLGDGTVDWHTAPVEIAGELRFKSISAGIGFTCGVTTSGAAFCWGQNDHGQLGDGSTIDRLAPVPVAGGLTFAIIAAGVSHACGLTSDGAAYCWGDNAGGELGDGTRQPRLLPTAVGGEVRFRVP